MKKEQIEVKEKRYVFVCDVCGKKSPYESDIIRCEEWHKFEDCLHDKSKYEMYFDDDICINKCCSNCGKTLDDTYIEIDDISEELMTQLFDYGKAQRG